MHLQGEPAALDGHATVDVHVAPPRPAAQAHEALPPLSEHLLPFLHGTPSQRHFCVLHFWLLVALSAMAQALPPLAAAVLVA